MRHVTDRVKGVAIVASAEPLSIVKELLGDGGDAPKRPARAAEAVGQS